jgi:hypothetical protein
MAKLTNDFCDKLFQEQSITTKRHVAAILLELRKAEEKHPIWPTSEENFDGQPIPKGDFVHAAAIVVEEAGELIRASLQFAWESGRYYEMHKEAIQVGAMSIRFLNNAPEMPLENNEKEVSNG